MSQNITLMGASYSAVPAVTLPKTGGGTASFTDVTDTTAAASDVASGKYFYTAAGVRTAGAGSSDSTFVVNVSWNNSSQMWEPDCTWAEVNAAAQAGKELVAEGPTIDDMVAADCVWNADQSVLYYLVYYLSSSTQWACRVYALSSDGIELAWDDSISAPTGTITIANSGNTNVAGYATAYVASGTAGVPKATKSAVGNHSISVTPSVTNTTGYITGSTKTGTAVSVSASELVSGTLSITSSGTKDVTNYASASVASGGATASATKGAVSNHSVTVTPSVTRTAGYVTAGSSNGTAVTVSASELVSGNKAITQNGSNIDVADYATVSVNVSGGGDLMIATATSTPATASRTITFTGLSGEPTSFHIVCQEDLATASQAKVAAVAYDGTDHTGQTVTNTSNAQASFDGGFSHAYSNGTLTVTATTAYFQAEEYALCYTYGGGSANIGTKDVQVGSGATSITFTGLPDEPSCWSCVFTSNFSTSSGYQRVIAVANDGTDTYGLEMDSAAHYSDQHWTSSYSNGSLTITSQGTNAGGYFHQPGNYHLTYAVGGKVDVTIEPLTVTQNGVYSESGKAYSPVTVSVSGGGGSVSVDQVTWTNNSTSTVSHQFTGLKGTPKFAVLRCTAQLTRSSSNTYYYIADIVWDGTDAWGNYHLRSNGSFNNVAKDAASGFNVTVSGSSITFSSDATSRSSAPGSFYNSTYELTYVY